ncbi:MAG TPA: methyltransferase domain-containing protein [Bauldia sp.]|nr:methyltransferase domain-containing protein [Bauldia sp.]
MAERVGFYKSTYGNFGAEVLAAVRAETYGRDIGQNSWLTADEQERFGSFLNLAPGRRLLEVACGSGGPALFLAETFGVSVEGIDVSEPGVAAANAAAMERGLTGIARFGVADATRPLPFPDASFDAIQCIDAVNHLRDRAAVLAEWRRVLRPDGLLLYTDPIVVTGVLTSDEIATRSSIGLFLFVPDGENQRLLRDAGFRLVRHEDVTDNEVLTSARWIAARERHRDDLIAIEGADTYMGTQDFLQTVHALSASRRLSRHLFVAQRSSEGAR